MCHLLCLRREEHHGNDASSGRLGIGDPLRAGRSCCARLAVSARNVSADEARNCKETTGAPFRPCECHAQFVAAICSNAKAVKLARRQGYEAMLPLRYFAILAGLVLFGSTAALVGYDIYLSTQLRRLLNGSALKKPDTAATFRGSRKSHRLILVASEPSRAVRR